MKCWRWNAGRQHSWSMVCWKRSTTALVVACEYLPVGPFGLEGPVEAFDLAVLPGAVRFDQDVVDVEVVE